MEKIYEDGTYLANNPGWHEEDSPWKAQKIAAIMKKNGLTPKTIGEVGCGAGEVLNQLSQLCADVECVGYDISPQAFEICKTKIREGLSYRLADVLEDGKAQFDLMLAIDVFEHVEDYFMFLRKLRVKADYKIFHIPLDVSVLSVLTSFPILKARKVHGHIHYFTKETALESLKDTGYSIVDYCYTAGALDLPNRSWRTNLLKIPRRLAFWLNRDWAVRLLGGYALLVLAK